MCAEIMPVARRVFNLIFEAGPLKKALIKGNQGHFQAQVLEVWVLTMNTS